MQEFESISASSYDPAALATKLTAKAAEGWSVVAIVPTGGDVTAFVTREKNGDVAADTPAVEAPAETVDDKVDDEPKFELPATTEPTVEPVSEPSGWAIAPEPAAPTPAPVTTSSVEQSPSYQPTSTYQPSLSTAAAATPSVTPAPAAAPEPAPAPSVPAGWYADPAGRFELRYWDGSTWTEHVSRAGQQFTDPPVA
jgi:hypothetical protein